MANSEIFFGVPSHGSPDINTLAHTVNNLTDTSKVNKKEKMVKNTEVEKEVKVEEGGEQ